MQQRSSSYGAVILAAGFSSRMGDFKPLLQVDGKPALQNLIDQVKASGIKNIVVVTGHNRRELQTIIHQGCIAEAYNDRYSEGMFTSIQTGLKKLAQLQEDREDAPLLKGALLIPVDCPLITHSIISKLIDAVEGTADTTADSAVCADNAVANVAAAAANTDKTAATTATTATGAADAAGAFDGLRKSSFAVPVFQGKKGHPLLIPADKIEEICSYRGDGGLKAITDREEKILRVPVDDEGCVLDMDTPEGYREILDFLRAGRRRQPISKLKGDRELCLMRHGETQQHKEAIFIGQYDVELNDAGRESIRRGAEQLKRSGYVPQAIYTSPLKRAVESARIAAEVLWGDEDNPQGPEIIILKELQELSLGGWDGRPISEIKEKYPDAYRRRGEDIFAFKIGNGSENFYDLQYRVIKELRGILSRDSSERILIVTHSGVIRAIQNNLQGKSVDDPWQPVSKGGYVIV